MDLFNKVIKESSFLYLGQVYLMAAGFVLVMVLTRLLSVDDFGKYIFAQSVVNIIIVFGNLGLPRALTRYIAFYKGQNNWGLIKDIVKKIGLHIISLNILLSVVTFVTVSYYDNIFFKFEGIAHIIALLALTFPFRSVSNIVISFFSGLQQMFYPSVLLNVSLPTLKISLVILLLIFSRSLLIEWIYGLIIIFIINGIIAAYIFIKKKPEQIITKSSEKIDQKEIYTFAVPIFMSALVTIAIENVDLVVLGYFGIAKDLGIYKIYKIVTILIITFVSHFKNHTSVIN